MDGSLSGYSVKIARWGGLAAAAGGIAWITAGVFALIYGQSVVTDAGRVYQMLAGLTLTIASLLLCGGILGLYFQTSRRGVRAGWLRWTALAGLLIAVVVILVSAIDLIRVLFLAPIITGTLGVPELSSGFVGRNAIAISTLLLGLVGLRVGVLGALRGLPLGIGLLMISHIIYLLLVTPFFLIETPEGIQLDFLAYSGLLFFFFLLPFGFAGAGWVLLGLLLWTRAEQ